MDQETAQKLFYNAGIMVFLDAPKQLHFGVDYKSWQIGPKFKGVKFIPPGLHFIYYGSVNSFGDYGARTGFFKYFDEKEIIVKEWDTNVEDLKEDSEMDKDQVERIKYNIKEFDQFLGPYPLVPQDKESVNVYHRWLSLTSKINKKVIKLILPEDGKLSAINSISHFSEIKEGNDKGDTNIDNDTTMTNADADADASTSSTSFLHDTNAQKSSSVDQEKYRLNFTVIDLKKSYPEHATTEEITKYSIDKSYLLMKIIKNDYKGDLNLFLGEFQLSYIIFLIGQVYDGFEQWKTMIILMLQCEEALQTYGETLFKDFLVILNDQLKDFPHDFFYDILSGSNFLRSSLKMFYRIIRKTNGQYPLLQEQLKLLLDHLSKTFKWDLEEEFHEIDRNNVNIMKEKLEDCLRESQQHSSNNNNNNNDNDNDNNNSIDTSKHFTVEDLNNHEQLLKLMEELGIEDEEDLPVIVNLDE